MELGFQDVRAIGFRRYDINYFKRHSGVLAGLIVSSLFLIIGCIGMMCLQPKIQDEAPLNTYKTLSGNEMQVSSYDDVIVVGNDVYLLSKDEKLQDSPNNVGYKFGAIIFLASFFSFFSVFIWYWYKRDEFIDKFVQYWIDKKEFLEAD